MAHQQQYDTLIYNPFYHRPRVFVGARPASMPQEGRMLSAGAGAPEPSYHYQASPLSRGDSTKNRAVIVTALSPVRRVQQAYKAAMLEAERRAWLRRCNQAACRIQVASLSQSSSH